MLRLLWRCHVGPFDCEWHEAGHAPCAASASAVAIVVDVAQLQSQRADDES